jgi:hydroxymethylbilane synthase
MVPSPGQGVVTLEARSGDAVALAAAEAVNDDAAWTVLRCERALVVGLDATCHTPVGAFAVTDGTELVVSAFAGLPDGSEWVRDRLAGPASEPEALGALVAVRLRDAGGADLLRRAEAIAA